MPGARDPSRESDTMQLWERAHLVWTIVKLTIGSLLLVYALYWILFCGVLSPARTEQPWGTEITKATTIGKIGAFVLLAASTWMVIAAVRKLQRRLAGEPISDEATTLLYRARCPHCGHVHRLPNVRLVGLFKQCIQCGAQFKVELMSEDDK